MTYQELTIHQKINIKSKVGIHPIKSVMRRVTANNPLCYGSPGAPWWPTCSNNANFELGWNQSYH